MNKTVHIVAGIGVLSAALLAHANTFFVATDGSDLHDGLSPELPLRSLQAAADLVRPGDRVLIRGGTYREMVEFLKGGHPLAGITISPYSNETVTIRGDVTVTNWAPVGDSVWAVTNWPINCQQVFVDDLPIQQIGWPPGFENAYIAYRPTGTGLADLTDNSFFYETNSKNLYLKLPPGTTPQQHNIETGFRPAVFRMTERSPCIRVADLNLVRANGTALLTQQFTHALRCRIAESAYNGLYQGRDSVAEDCVIEHNGFSGVGWFPGHTNITVRGCRVFYNNRRGMRTEFGGSGMKLIPHSSGTVEDNEVAWNFGTGIWFDFCRNGDPILVQRNYVHHNRPLPNDSPYVRGIFIEVSKNAVVRNNLVVDNEGFGIDVSNSDNVTVANNTVIGTRGYAGIQVNHAGRLLSTNPVPEYATLTNNAVLDNLILDSVCAHDLLMPPESAETNYIVAGNTSDYNCIYRHGAPLALTLAGHFRTSSLETWQQQSGLDEHSQVVDPVVMDPYGGDWRPAPESPLIDAGATGFWSSATTDFAGMPRVYAGLVDQGCFEYAPGFPPDFPSVQVTSRVGLVSYDETTVSGVNNATVQGKIWISNRVGSASSRCNVTRNSRYDWVSGPFLVAGATNWVDVFATNSAGNVTTQSVVVVRGPTGTGKPVVYVDTEQPIVIPAGDAVLSGHVNEHVAGAMHWRHQYAGSVMGEGTVWPSNQQWSLTVTGLQPAWNYIIVSASNLWGVTGSATGLVHFGDTTAHYVAANSPSPRYPYTSWSTAATIIQVAVDAASDGDVIWVAPGTYRQGGRTNEYGVSRVVLDRGVTLTGTDARGGAVVEGALSGSAVPARGILMTHADARLRNLTIENGYAGTPPYNRGGGVLATAMNEITHCVVRNASTSAYGYGGGICTWNVNGTITDCLVENCSAWRGGGIHVQFGSQTALRNIRVHQCKATGQGGGLSIDNCRTIENCVIHANTAQESGGGILMGNGTRTMHSTVELNEAPVGAGVYAQPQGGGAEIVNSIFALNSTNDFAAKPGTESQVTLTRCQTDSPIPAGVATNQLNRLLPLYVDPANGDFRLLTNSPGVDAIPPPATVPFDFRNAPRPLDGNGDGSAECDAGAFEAANPTLDSDGDDLNDWWEVENGLNPLRADAREDPDQDRMSNLDEFIAGTDPLASTSFLGITKLTTALTHITLHWQAASNRTYRVWSANDVSQWTSDAPTLTATSYFGGAMSVTGMMTGDFRQFYRITVKRYDTEK